MTNRERRHFLQSGAVATGVAVVQGFHNTVQADDDTVSTSPSERIVVGVMGLNRGKSLVTSFARQPNVVVKYLCDVDRGRLSSAVKKHAAESGKSATPVEDFRKILDDQEVDALVCAAPNHWHAPATILACSAGKHVYVEKPCSHNPREGELMVEAARRHRRAVQMGTQRRSNRAWIDAIQLLRDGAIGRVYHARAWYNSLRGSVGTDRFIDPPAYLNYELWQGPAPRRPYSPAVVHYNWHWRWHWGNGELGNNGVHTLDLCRWGLNVELPTLVTSEGGRFVFDDAQETPDTNTVSFNFDDKCSITWVGLSCNRHSYGFITFYGTDGTMEVGSDGQVKIFDRSDKLVREKAGAGNMQEDHVANFLAAIRQDQPETLRSEIEIGHKSTLLCHLGNISYRTGRTLHCDAASGRIKHDEEAMTLWAREYAPGWEPKIA